MNNSSLDIYFYRWGDLNSVKHKESRLKDCEKSMHTAPRVYGIYAFLRGFVERFLIGGSYTHHSVKYLLDEDGNKIPSNDFWDLCGDKIKPFPKYQKLLKKRHIKIRDVHDGFFDEETETWYMTYFVKPHKFYYSGLLWHHLGHYCDSSEIIDKTEYWTKTTFKAYCKALHKCDTIERFKSYLGEDWGKKKEDRHGDPHTHINCFTKDHYEVFIEKVK